METPNNNQDNQENTSFYDQVDQKNLLRKGVMPDKAAAEVRENEDASLQDDSYSFDEDNTDNEEYHDADSDFDLDNDDDFVQ